MTFIKNIIKYFYLPNYKVNVLVRKIKYGKRNIIIRKKLFKQFNIQIGSNTVLGNNLIFPHPFCIVLGEKAVIGDNCTIYHEVTIGKKKGNLDSEEDYPTIGDNVTIFPGTKIFGKINIGDNSIIAANSVVNTNIEPNTIYGGIPAKKIGEVKLNS